MNGRSPAPEEDQPFFRFHPGAYNRSFEPSEAVCPACRRTAIWLYIDNFYSVAGSAVCARCIASGRAAEMFKGEFFDTRLEGAAPALRAEVLQRTPGFPVFNPFDWPVLDGAPLAFIGYGDEPAVWNDAEARAAINAAFEEEAVAPAPYALVFKELDGPRYVAVVDLD